jgi:hypothetical protein
MKAKAIKASELRTGMTVRRITNKAYGKVYDKPVLHTTGHPWPTVTRVEYPGGDVWFMLSCCTSEAIRLAPDDEVTIEEQP